MIDERFIQLRRNGSSRYDTVGGHVARMSDWAEAHGVDVESFDRDHVLAMLTEFARAPRSLPADLPDGVRPDQLVTMSQALALPGLPSRSTLKRAAATGRLDPVRDGDRVRYRVSDLYTLVASSPVSRGTRRRYGYAQPVLSDLRQTFEAVMAYAADYHVDVPRDRASLGTPATDRPAAPKRAPVSLADTALLATQLHVVHQLVLWLTRILGLRIGEAFGVRISDLLDDGPGKPGLLRVHRQGGQVFQPRDAVTGLFVPASDIDSTKTVASDRWVVVPGWLMDLSRLVIAIFHTDLELGVRQDARLVPGLTRLDEAGQAAFRSAVARAARTCGVTAIADTDFDEGLISVTPHNFPASVITELRMCEHIDEVARKRFAGHLPGTSVHARHYLWDDPLLREQREVADALSDMIANELPDGLMIPTTVRCTTGSQSLLAVDAVRIDAELAEAGWLIRAQSDGEVLLTAVEVAAACGCKVQAARRWLADGVIASEVIEVRAHGTARGARWSAVEAFLDARAAWPTLAQLADELDVAYSRLYQFVRTQGFEPVPLGARGVSLPPAEQAAVRSHYRAEALLHATSMTIAAAVTELGLPQQVIASFIRAGRLVEDRRAHDGRRMVTRSSVLATGQALMKPRSRYGRR